MALVSLLSFQLRIQNKIPSKLLSNDFIKKIKVGLRYTKKYCNFILIDVTKEKVLFLGNIWENSDSRKQLSVRKTLVK